MSKRELLIEKVDKPNAVLSDGTKVWYNKYGQLHRERGKPAKIYPDGTEEYWVDGKGYKVPLRLTTSMIQFIDFTGFCKGKLFVTMGVPNHLGKTRYAQQMAIYRHIIEMAREKNTIIITAVQKETL